MKIDVLFSEVSTILETTFSEAQTISIPREVYDGPTEVTPSGIAQILNTSGKEMASNITVNPIPSNYGLITWNGTVLTVS